MCRYGDSEMGNLRNRDVAMCRRVDWWIFPALDAVLYVYGVFYLHTIPG